MRSLVSVVPLVLAGLVLTGCGAEEQSVRAAVERFDDALARHDAGLACAQLSPAARTALVEQEQAPCPRALVQLDLAPAAIADVELAITTAQARLENGQSVFLDRTSAGWRISAAGCEPSADGGPYDCELEA